MLLNLQIVLSFEIGVRNDVYSFKIAIIYTLGRRNKLQIICQ